MVTHDPRAAERASALLHLDKGVLIEAAHKREALHAEARA
jgi:ABC-type lipoprotein export system ATPase subunit